MSARDAVFSSADLLEELMPWGLGDWHPHRPPYATACSNEVDKVPIDQLLRVLLDERPWARALSDFNVADAVRSWLRGVLRNIVTRRRVCKTWAVAGKRCFETLVAELRHRGAAHARAARAFLRTEPEVYVGTLPSDGHPDPATERTNLVRAWSRDAEGAKHVSLLQAIFEYPFQHIGTPVTPITEQEAMKSFFAKHLVWPRSWVSKLAGLVMPINERQLWDTLHRRCRCCPRGTRCCVHKDRAQMMLRSGGDGYGTAYGDHNANYNLGPWPEVEGGRDFRVGRSVIPADGACVTASMTAVCEPVRETADGSPCMLCNWCVESTLPYTSEDDTATLCIQKMGSDIKAFVLFDSDNACKLSSARLLHMLYGSASPDSRIRRRVADLYNQRVAALAAVPGARARCACTNQSHNMRNLLTVTLTLFETEEGSNHSWATLFGLTRAEFMQKAVQWPFLQWGSPDLVEQWRKLELKRRVSLLNASLPGRYGDHSIMIRDENSAFYHAFYKLDYTTCPKSNANHDHLSMYAPLLPLLKIRDSDPISAHYLGTMAATQYKEKFGTDEAMIEYFQTVESLIGAAWVQTIDLGEDHVLKADDRHKALRRLAHQYIIFNSGSLPLSDDDRIKAIAGIPAMGPTHPQLLLRWFLAAICRRRHRPRDMQWLDVKNVAWMPSTTRSGPPPEKLACRDLVVYLSFSAPESVDSIHGWPTHMRFAFALRMHHLCDLATMMTKKADPTKDKELSLKEWNAYANCQAYGLSRMSMLDESNTTLLFLFESILQFPWVSVFPRRSTDPEEGTVGIRALGSVCNRGTWYGDVHPICKDGSSFCEERGLDCCQCSRECKL